jgi:flagellar biogenesis protein FliO
MGEGRLLRVVGRASLSPKHSVVLLGLGRRFLLLGIAGDRVTALAEVSDPEEVAELSLRLGSGLQRSGEGFGALLTRESGAYEDVTHATDVFDEPVSASAKPPGREPLGDLLQRLRALQSN